MGKTSFLPLLSCSPPLPLSAPPLSIRAQNLFLPRVSSPFHPRVSILLYPPLPLPPSQVSPISSLASHVACWLFPGLRPSAFFSYLFFSLSLHSFPYSPPPLMTLQRILTMQQTTPTERLQRRPTNRPLKRGNTSGLPFFFPPDKDLHYVATWRPGMQMMVPHSPIFPLSLPNFAILKCITLNYKVFFKKNC